MAIENLEFVKGFTRMCNDGWLQGWHERNGGNLTYRLTDDEVAAAKPFFDAEPREWVEMGVTGANLGGAYFLATGSGKYMRNVAEDPAHNIGIVQINEEGTAYRIVWGLLDGAKPTSEFPSHFMNHSVRVAATNGAEKGVMIANVYEAQTIKTNLEGFEVYLIDEGSRLEKVEWNSEEFTLQKDQVVYLKK